MFWDLKGAILTPRRTRQRQIAATVTLFPTWDAEPTTNRDMPVLISGFSDHKKQHLKENLEFIAGSGNVPQ